MVKKSLICCIYRAPKTELEQLNEFISNCCQNTRNKTVYLCGDFNIDLLLVQSEEGVSVHPPEINF